MMVNWSLIANSLRAASMSDPGAWIQVGFCDQTRLMANSATSGRVKALEGIDVEVEVRRSAPDPESGYQGYDTFMRIKP